MILQEEELEFRRSGEPTETKNKKLIVSYFGFVIENSNDLNTGFPNAINIGKQDLLFSRFQIMAMSARFILFLNNTLVSTHYKGSLFT